MAREVKIASDKETLAVEGVISTLFPVYVPGSREHQGYGPEQRTEPAG